MHNDAEICGKGKAFLRIHQEKGVENVSDVIGFSLMGGRGENVAKGYTDGTQAVQAFKKSSAHYKNMVSEEFTDIGIGVAAAPDGTLYWCMILTVNNKDAD